MALAPWPTDVTPISLSGGMDLDRDGSPYLEPSGLTIVNTNGYKYLYMASDNGKIARYNLDKKNDDWGVIHNYSNDNDGDDEDNHDEYDFESMTVANGQFMVGVEGDTSAQTKILNINPDNGNILKTWILQQPNGIKSGKGMEAMTFVSYSNCPQYWKDTINDSTCEGVYLAGYQSFDGTIYVYRLTDDNTANVPYLADLTFSTGGSGSNMMISDMCFANGTLFVLYDDTTDLFQMLDISSLTATSTTATLLGESVPADYSSHYTQNYEGITVDGNDLYLSTDPGGKLGSIYQFKNFNFDAITGS